MKNLKNILATLVLVTVVGASSSFGGVFITDRSVNDTREGCKATPTMSTGIMLGAEGIMLGVEGIMLGLEGIMLGVTRSGCSAQSEGIMLG